MRVLLLVSACACLFAQSQSHFRNSAAWLEGYRHAEVPPPAAPVEPDPLLEALYDVQRQTMSLIRQARLAENLHAAADAIREARANAAAIAAALKERRERETARTGRTP